MEEKVEIGTRSLVNTVTNCQPPGIGEFPHRAGPRCFPRITTRSATKDGYDATSFIDSVKGETNAECDEYLFGAGGRYLSSKWVPGTKFIQDKLTQPFDTKKVFDIQ